MYFPIYNLFVLKNIRTFDRRYFVHFFVIYHFSSLRSSTFSKFDQSRSHFTCRVTYKTRYFPIKYWNKEEPTHRKTERQSVMNIYSGTHNWFLGLAIVARWPGVHRKSHIYHRCWVFEFSLDCWVTLNNNWCICLIGVLYGFLCISPVCRTNFLGFRHIARTHKAT